MANPDTPEGNGDNGLERSFQAALRAAKERPASQDAWDHLEELADSMQRPDEVADAYRAVLEAGNLGDDFEAIAERAVGFQEEWFGDTPEKITSLMSRIIELDPSAEWAFERLSVMLTSGEQWEELLALYDRTLAATSNAERRVRLLEDAASVARDFAGQAERAADYMQQQLAADPDNAQLVTSLERVLERQGRFTDLIDLWLARLDNLDASEKRATRLRVATCQLEKLENADLALEQLRTLLSESPGNADACALLERILTTESSSAESRRASLAMLRESYLVADQPEAIVRVLESALTFASAEDERALHRELGSRLAILGRDVDAIAQYAALVVSQPSDADARKQLRVLTTRADRHDLRAEALLAAAEASEDAGERSTVLFEAANLYNRVLDDRDKAIELFKRVLDAEDTDDDAALTAAHRLSDLLAAAERPQERLTVLEKLATLERAPALRRFVLGQTADLAASLGDADRALASWQLVLDGSPNDVEALAATTALLEQAERWSELAEALTRRAAASVLPLQRRADLVQLAKVQVERLERVDLAIDTWLKIRDEFGEDSDTLAAVDGLMGSAGRWQELADLLGGAAMTERTRAGGLLTRLGDIHRLELSAPNDALPWYDKAIAVDPASAAAREGLVALLDTPECRGRAAAALALAYRTTDDWRELAGLLDHRLAGARDQLERVTLLREAAHLHESRGEDTAAALAALVQALPLSPASLALEADLLRLAAATDSWADACGALRAAAEASDVPGRSAELSLAAARLLEGTLADPAGALEAYQGANALAPNKPDTLDAITRMALATGALDAAAPAAVKSASLRDRLTAELRTTLEEGVAGLEAEQVLALARGFTAAIAEVAPRGELAQELELMAAAWFGDRAGAVEEAEAATLRASTQGPPRLELLVSLANLQRRALEGGATDRGTALIETLERVDQLSERDLASLHEAAQLALAHDLDVSHTQRLLEQLYRKAGGMWSRNVEATGDADPASTAQWALDKLIAHHVLVGNAERAVDVLLDGSRLPLAIEKVTELKRRAGEMLAEAGDHDKAIDVYRGVIDADPNDKPSLQRVAELCEKAGRVTEALNLRLRELELTEDRDRRLELRLAHSRLTGALEAKGGRVASLRANLADAPGHAPTVAELEAVLQERGKHQDLADILREQAEQIEGAGDNRLAAELWTKVAQIGESELRDAELAMTAFGRVVDLEAQGDEPTTTRTNGALDALARLHLERGEPAKAAAWLERRMVTTGDADRVAVLLKLARARLRAEQRESAASALETAFGDAPRNAEVRMLLLKLHRSNENWEALAATLSRAAEHAADSAKVLAYAREAASIYNERLGAPERAVGALRRAVELDPDDRSLRGMLAHGLRVAGELEEARSILEALIADFGRRRSPERAATHLQLAHVLHAQGSVDEAIDQVDKASKMDSGNPTILRTLAEMARDAEQLDRAERAYRTLLMTVRRADDDEVLPIGPSEVLLELSRLAATRDDAEKASQLLESVVESILQNDYEAPRVQAKLKESGEHALLERVLRARLEHVTTPHVRATIWADLGELLDGDEARADEAVDAALEAVKEDPGSPVYHQHAWDRASNHGKLERYISEVEALLSDERADASPLVRCELLLRLGEVLEKERSDLDRASELYGKAEATGVRKVDVWRAQARVAGARGDSDTQVAILEKLTSVGEDGEGSRADAMYRLAEVQLANIDLLGAGIESLDKALEVDFKAERAGMILEGASEQHPSSVPLLDIYERVARRSENPRMMLHYLDKRATHADATPEQAREAAEAALAQEAFEHAEQLMLRAVELAKTDDVVDPEQLARIDWALLGLAERRKAAGDIAGAVKWLGEAADVADLSQVFALGSEVAELAGGPDGDLTLAAKLYEHLIERAPTAREAWEPLARIYAQLGDIASLEKVVAETLDGLQATDERAALRVQLASALLGDDERALDAVDILKSVLAEDPGHEEAHSLLVKHLESTGNMEELSALLRQQLEQAVEREDARAIKNVSMRLAERVEAEDADEALAIYRRALEWAPEDADLLVAIVDRMSADEEPREVAALMERLVALEEDDAAAQRALSLAKLYSSIGDEDGALRALKGAYERKPTDNLRRSLEQRYRERGDYAGVVAMLLAATESEEDVDQRVALLREAAAVRRDHLEDAAGAAELLGEVCELVPDDMMLRVDYAKTLSAAGNHDAGVASLGEMLDRTEDAGMRLRLLAARANLNDRAGAERARVEDLELAFEISPEAIAPNLEHALENWRQVLADLGDVDEERRVTLRVVDVMMLQSKRGEASMALATWTDLHPDDAEALRRLLELDTEDERWDAVVQTCRQLINLEEGEAQVQAVLALSHACRQAGTPEDARDDLDRVFAQQPESAALRNELRAILEEAGDHAQLAKLLIEDSRTEEGAEKAALLLRAGQLYVELGDANSAVPPLRAANDETPGDATTIVALADAYILAGWFDDANELLDEAINAGRGRRTPEACLYHFRKAHVAEVVGDKTAQFGFLQEAHLCAKKNGIVAAALANLAEELEEWETAAKTLRTISLIDTECPVSRAEAFFRQGKIARLQGDDKAAKMWARRARREDPDDAEIEGFLMELDS